MKWMPIETAPKDGSVFLVKGGRFNCAYSQIDGFAVDSPNEVYYKEQTNHDVDPPYRVVGEYFGIDNPAHWMPLPPAPETKT